MVFGLAALTVAACVSIDNRVSTEPIDRAATQRISGDFSNRASYRSTGEFLARDNLADLLGVPAKTADRVRISGDPNEALTITWYLRDEEKASRLFSKEFGLAIAADGLIDLQSEGKWGSGEGAFGYETHSVRIFINSNGDLATVQLGGGGGLFGPFPVGVYARHLAIFPRR